MAGWHHRLDGCGFGWTLGVGDGQGGLACCDSWGHKESDTTEQLNWTQLTEFYWIMTWEYGLDKHLLYVIVYACTCAPSCWFFVTPKTAACRTPLSMEFSRQKYWSGLPFPAPGYLSHSQINPSSLALAGEFFTTEPPGKPMSVLSIKLNLPEINLRGWN